MSKTTLQFYGIDFTNKLMPFPKESTQATLKKICCALLCSDLPIKKVKKTIRTIEEDYPAKKLVGLLRKIEKKQQKFELKWERLTKGKGFYYYQAKQTLLDRFQEWVQVFDKPKPAELLDFESFLQLKNHEKEMLQKNMKLWTYNTPAKIKDYLNEYVIGQEAAKEMVSWAFYTNLLRTGRLLSKNKGVSIDKLPKSNLLLLGPSGSGKTYLIERLAALFEVPFQIIDCAGLVCSGYVGRTLSDVFAQLIRTTPNLFEAQRSVLFFDEFDKMASSIGFSNSVGGQELQSEFLSIMQKGEITARLHQNHKQVIKTDNILFIFGGAFTGIDKIMESRLNLQSIGFQHPPIVEQALDNVIAEDIIKFGIMPELVNRLSYISRLYPLTKPEVLQIMHKAKDSAVDEFKTYFEAHHQSFTIEDEVYEVIADKVVESGKGARQINYLLHDLFRKVLYKSPSTKKSKWKFTIADLN